MLRMCSRCRHFRLDPADLLTPHGYGRCAHLSVDHYRSRQATGCYLTPSRFEEAAP